MSEKNGDPYDMDSASFDADKYLERLLQDCTLSKIMDTEAAVVKDTQTLHSDMQTLVYENYNKFISATDTIRQMKADFKQMETDMNILRDKMQTITTFSEKITGTLQGTRTQLCRLSEKHSLLKRLQFLSSLPAKLKSLIEDEKKYAQAVQDFSHAQKVFAQYGNQPSFDGIQRDCEVIMLDLKQRLRNDFQLTGNTAQSLTEIGELLLQLDERPADLASEMLLCASKRLHEQIVMLQDQTERDLIEFVDMGINGFLGDLTLVVTSYFDMFVAKNHENERDDFQETALRDLNLFLNENIDKYLTLVQDRVEAEIGCGDTQIMLRALDRLHRRILAMRNICRGLEVQRNTVDIIIAAAHQLCEVHTKNLKDNFADSLSAVRLALVSAKNVDGSPKLKELITGLYVAMLEKAKGVLQDLLVFLQTSWSFNIKSDYKGTLCVEGIRENLLIGFLRYISKVMCNFVDSSSSSPPNLLLVLSKTCLELEQSGVHILISLVDELYEIDSENSATLTHETEICSEMRETAQTLLDAYVRMQGTNISQMLRKSVETRDWLNCLEPRSVRAVMKRAVEELSSIEKIVAGLYNGNNVHTTASSDSSRKTHFSNLTASKQQQQYRSNWSNYTPSQLESNYVSNIHRLFSERVDIFTTVEFSKVSIVTGIIKIGLKTLLECVRLRTFSKFGLQQIQVDTHYLQMNLWRFVTDENMVNFLLDEILGSAVHRCFESILMEPNAVEIICERG